MKDKVAVTGMGIVTSFGYDYQKMFDDLCKGKSGITKFSEKFIGGKIKSNFYPKEFIKEHELKKLDPYSIYGIYAAHKAISDANIKIIDPNRSSVIVGTGIGGINTLYNTTSKKDKKISPFFISKILPNMLSGHISSAFNFKGASFGISAGCATGSIAIIEAIKMIQLDEADIVIAGASEAMLCDIGLEGFLSMNALSNNLDTPEKSSRPFDKKRDGFVVSDGSAILVLEKASLAIKRNANIHGIISGYGMSSNASHITNPDIYGEKLAMQKSLDNAKINLSDIDYINAHATGTLIGDKVELEAINQLFGPFKPMISSTKGATGHLLGASGSLEAIISILSIKNKIIPPTINIENPDTDNVKCNLVINTPRKKKLKYVMSNSFGFGGINVSIIFELF